MTKTNLINMEELTEDNDFGLALAERPSTVIQGCIIINLFK